MSDKDKSTGDETQINRREILKKGTLAGGALLSGTGMASASRDKDGKELLKTEEVKSIKKSIPGLNFKPKKIEVTAVNPVGEGKSIRVQCDEGTLYAADLPNDEVIAIFRFDNDRPPKKAKIETEIPKGSDAMLVGSVDGANLIRSAGAEEREKILELLELSDEEQIHIWKSSKETEFTVSQMEFGKGRIIETVVEPSKATTGTVNVAQDQDFNIVSRSVLTSEAEIIRSTATSCGCNTLAANIIMCFHSLGGCKTALGCGAFGGPYTILACAIATGCIYAILSEMFLSDAPGCVNLGQDIWEGCATDCIPGL